MATYRIGQVLTNNQDTLIEKALSGERVRIPEGNKIIIGPDGFAHHFRNGYIQPLEAGSEIKGYDSTGLAEYLYFCMNSYYQIKEDFLDEYKLDVDHFIENLECWLDDIGF